MMCKNGVVSLRLLGTGSKVNTHNNCILVEGEPGNEAAPFARRFPHVSGYNSQMERVIREAICVDRALCILISQF